MITNVSNGDQAQQAKNDTCLSNPLDQNTKKSNIVTHILSSSYNAVFERCNVVEFVTRFIVPIQLFLIKVIESPWTSSNHFKISFGTPFRCKHRLPSSDQWSKRKDNSNIGKICSESERLTLEMVGLTIYHKSDSFTTIVIARAQRLHHLRHFMVEVPITHLQTEIGKLNSPVQD